MQYFATQSIQEARETNTQSVVERKKPVAAIGARGRISRLPVLGAAAYDPSSVESARIKIMDRATVLTDLQFAEATDAWLEQRSLYIRESTADCYRDYIARLKAFDFPPLKEIHIGHFVTYQSAMKGRYHPASVNHDLNVLSQMLKAAGLWEPIRDHYRPLPLPELDPPKVMTEATEDAFFEFSSKREDWLLAYLVASATNNTTASGKELRMMQLDKVNLGGEPPTIEVPKNMKTPHRPRIIPLNERGAEMVARLVKRANKLGSHRPDHYLFPLRKKRNFFDPTKPASESWIKYRWKRLVDAAMLHNDPFCKHIGILKPDERCPVCPKGILSFRIKPHNLRHQAITKMLDEGIPIEVVRQIAGHGVDSLVTAKYHHGRLDIMKRALDRIDPNKKRPNNGFSNPNGKGERA